MPPSATQPLDRSTIAWGTSNSAQVVEHVVQAHLPKSVQESPGIFQHHAGLLAFVDQLWDELPHAFVAPMKHGGVVVVPDILVVHHVIEIANDLPCVQLRTSGRDQRLMHVEGDCAAALYPVE